MKSDRYCDGYLAGFITASAILCLLAAVMLPFI